MCAEKCGNANTTGDDGVSLDSATLDKAGCGAVDGAAQRSGRGRAMELADLAGGVESFAGVSRASQVTQTQDTAQTAGEGVSRGRAGSGLLLLLNA